MKYSSKLLLITFLFSPALLMCAAGQKDFPISVSPQLRAQNNDESTASQVITTEPQPQRKTYNTDKKRFERMPNSCFEHLRACDQCFDTIERSYNLSKAIQDPNTSLCWECTAGSIFAASTIGNFCDCYHRSTFPLNIAECAAAATSCSIASVYLCIAARGFQKRLLYPIKTEEEKKDK